MKADDSGNGKLSTGEDLGALLQLAQQRRTTDRLRRWHMLTELSPPADDAALQTCNKLDFDLLAGFLDSLPVALLAGLHPGFESPSESECNATAVHEGRVALSGQPASSRTEAGPRQASDFRDPRAQGSITSSRSRPADARDAAGVQEAQPASGTADRGGSEQPRGCPDVAGDVDALAADLDALLSNPSDIRAEKGQQQASRRPQQHDSARSESHGSCSAPRAPGHPRQQRPSAAAPSGASADTVGASPQAVQELEDWLDL